MRRQRVDAKVHSIGWTDIIKVDDMSQLKGVRISAFCHYLMTEGGLFTNENAWHGLTRQTNH